jgi:hypothetical protein
LDWVISRLSVGCGRGGEVIPLSGVKSFLNVIPCWWRLVLALGAHVGSIGVIAVVARLAAAAFVNWHRAASPFVAAAVCPAKAHPIVPQLGARSLRRQPLKASDFSAGGFDLVG